MWGRMSVVGSGWCAKEPAVTSECRDVGVIRCGGTCGRRGDGRVDVGGWGGEREHTCWERIDCADGSVAGCEWLAEEHPQDRDPPQGQLGVGKGCSQHLLSF